MAHKRRKLRGKGEKFMEQVYRIGIDHGYGNILCKGKYNPDTF
jgi:hypothetical protein